ncbi:MAG: NrfD/PsrC family molybdoenzyme membrane anchor subunit [Opitutales bacterium]
MPDNPPAEAPREALVAPELTPDDVSERISAGVFRKGGSLGWVFGFAVSFALLMLFLVSIAWLFAKGVGIWGIQIPVAWGFAIISFVWWIGIGHAGTFISAILLLLGQDWRQSINRLAEAMTLFAVACAGVFPLLHLGRPQFFYYILPYPNTLDLWPQFRSPLVWDFFAVLTYGTVSLLFWYLGLVPDLATLRDRARGWQKKVFAVIALGWTGATSQWHHYKAVYLVLAGLATPLVISVHSIVGLDFAYALVPGWHTTVFPPFFVAGAIFSGFAMVATIVVPLRLCLGLRDMITRKHLDNIGKLMLATGLMVGLGYLSESFFEWYSAESFERATVADRFAGPTASVFYGLVAVNLLSIQPLWSRKVRTSPWALFAISLLVNVGMWLERFLIVVTTLERDYLSSSWQAFDATFWDWSTYLGSLGLFFSLLFLFVRILPVVSIHEMRELTAKLRGKEAGDA